jgi:DNA ligase-1
MILPTLYKRTKTRKVQTWQIEFEDGKLRTITGQKDGKKNTSKWTVCEPTNEGRSNARNAEQQAEAEAQARWTLKRNENYFESEDDIDGEDVFLEPMLAEKYEELEEDLEFPVIAQPKLDGIRCIISREGMISRNNKPFDCAPHIIEELRELFEDYPDLKLDGELYNHKFKEDFNKIVTLVTTEDPKKKAKLVGSKDLIQFWIYDIQELGPTFLERYEKIKELKENYFKDSESLIVTPTKIVKDQKTLDKLFEQWLKEKYEGQMIRLDDGYEHRRTWSLMKRKPLLTDEADIIDLIEGKGNRSGGVGKFVLRLANGIEFKANVIGGQEYYEMIWKEKEKYKNKHKATFDYQNLTPKGKPRFARVKAIRNYE